MPTFSGSLTFPRETEINAALKQVSKTILEDGINKVVTEVWIDASGTAVSQVDRAVITYGANTNVYSIDITSGGVTETITHQAGAGQDAWDVADGLAEEIANIELVDGFARKKISFTVSTAAQEVYSLAISTPGQTSASATYTATASDTASTIAAQLFSRIPKTWLEVSQSGATISAESGYDMTISTAGTTTPANVTTATEAYLRIIANTPGQAVTYSAAGSTVPANFAVTNLVAPSGSASFKKVAEVKSWFAIPPGQRSVVSYIQRTFFDENGGVARAGRENSETHPKSLQDVLGV